jgi:hypothetical protein
MRIYNLHKKLLVPQRFRTGHTCKLFRNTYIQFTTHDIRTYCLETRIYNLHKKLLVPQRIHTRNTSVLFTEEKIIIYIGRCKGLFITKRKGNIHWNVRDLHRKTYVPRRIHKESRRARDLVARLACQETIIYIGNYFFRF